MSNWKKIRYRLEWLGVQWLYFAIPRLPRKWALQLGKALGSLAFMIDRRGRSVAIENLTLIYGSEKSERMIRLLARDSYRGFAQTVVDQFWSSRLNKDNYLNYCETQIDDPEALEKALETGAIWVTPHYGNFEWIALIMGFHGYKFTIIAQEMKNSSLIETYKKNRELSGHEVITPGGATMRLLDNLEKGGHAAFLTDLTIPPSRSATVIECFGLKTCVTSIHVELMRVTGLPIIPGICIPRPDGTYLLRGFKPIKIGPEDNRHTIAQACWNVFEPIIRENPAPWLWMYKHWRFLPEGEESFYPSYARRDEKFIKALTRIRDHKD
ncbi:MAG TPA: lysophospholipid acyltransferase family protein [Verrucomicrobiales bacterium]|nr:lysophospholipid acyltransferase family protein [Verrucomicrobiales bacterium]